MAQDAGNKTNTSAVLDTTKKIIKPNSLVISADLRVRTEVRHGYRVLPSADTLPAIFTNQRTRLNFDYKNKNFDLYASLQDTRVWGQQDPRQGQGTVTPVENTTYPLYMFEIYAEPHFTDKISVRIGRQRIMYDNQRLFAENDWRLVANSHDAVRFIYNNKTNFTTEVIGAFNQYGENNFTTNYKPVGFNNYKVLLVHYVNYKINKAFTLTTINAADGYQSSHNYKTTHMRFTSGGRIEFAHNEWYATVSSYYQYGKDSAGKSLSAHFIQPEIRYSGKLLSARLGAEYFSGQDSAKMNLDNNFVPLYGVAHRFNGTMDFFTTFPADLNNGGLFNPYLMFQYQSKNKRLVLRQDNHLFYTVSNSGLKGSGTEKKYLGYEFDARLNYKMLDNIMDLETGFSWASVTPSMIAVKKTGDADAFPWWFYVSVRFTPTLGKFTF